MSSLTICIQHHRISNTSLHHQNNSHIWNNRLHVYITLVTSFIPHKNNPVSFSFFWVVVVGSPFLSFFSPSHLSLKTKSKEITHYSISGKTTNHKSSSHLSLTSSHTKRTRFIFLFLGGGVAGNAFFISLFSFLYHLSFKTKLKEITHYSSSSKTINLPKLAF